jgi:two-component system NarL family sensor kinase
VFAIDQTTRPNHAPLERAIAGDSNFQECDKLGKRQSEVFTADEFIRHDVRQLNDWGSRRVTATVRIDAGGTIRSASASAAAMLGYTPEELVGRPLVELAAPGSREAIEGAISRFPFGTGETFDLQLQGRSGRRTAIRLAICRLVEAGRGDVEFIAEWEAGGTFDAPYSATLDDGPELRRFAYSLLRGQEAERLRVRGDLHDGVAPMVLMVKFTLEDAMQRLARGATRDAAEAMNAAARQLRDVLTELRKISSDLRPSLLDDLGLIPAIEWFCRQFESTHRTLRVERVIEVDEHQVADHLKLEIFRIIQEAMSNAARHAEATRVLVTLAIADDELVATVDDDGVGFDASELFYGNACPLGIGLLSIRKRICATDGRLLLDSVAGRGTLIGAAWKAAEMRRAANAPVQAVTP